MIAPMIVFLYKSVWRALRVSDVDTHSTAQKRTECQYFTLALTLPNARRLLVALLASVRNSELSGTKFQLRAVPTQKIDGCARCGERRLNKRETDEPP